MARGYALAMTLLAARRREIVQQLLGRPGHEKAGALLNELLVHGLEIPDDAVHLEQSGGTLVGFPDRLCGRTVFEIKSDLRRETAAAEEELSRHLPQVGKDSGGRCLGIVTDGLTWVPYRLLRAVPTALPDFRPSAESPQELLEWLRTTTPLPTPPRPTPEPVRTCLGRESLTYEAARLDLVACWELAKADPGMLLRRRVWAGLLESVYGSVPQDPAEVWLQHTYLVIVAIALASRAVGMPADDPDQAAATARAVAAAWSKAIVPAVAHDPVWRA